MIFVCGRIRFWFRRQSAFFKCVIHTQPTHPDLVPKQKCNARDKSFGVPIHGEDASKRATRPPSSRYGCTAIVAVVVIIDRSLELLFGFLGPHTRHTRPIWPILQ